MRVLAPCLGALVLLQACSGSIGPGGAGGGDPSPGAGGGSGSAGGSGFPFPVGGGSGSAGGGSSASGGGAGPGGWQYRCDPASASGATLATVRSEFIANVFPLMTRTEGGCVACHATTNRFRVTANGGETFDILNASGMLEEGASFGVIARLIQPDENRMPKGGNAWKPTELDAVGAVVCKLANLESSPCDAPGMVEPGPAPIRRLTPHEWDNTVKDLLGDTSKIGESTFPLEAEALGFDNNADVQTVDVLRAEKLIAASETLAKAANLATLAPCASQATVPANCGSNFIATFGKKAFRAPVPPAEVTRLTALYDGAKTKYGAPDAIRMVMQSILLSSRFLYRVEIGGGTSGQVVKVPSQEMASRLSYFLWQAPPDATLLAAAEADELKTPAQVEAQARRLLADARAKPVVADFHAQWLQLGLLDLADKVPAVVANFEALKPLMRTEAERTYEDVFWNGTANGYFTTTSTFVNKPLADFYGMTGATGAAFVKLPLDTTKRMGVLTQGAFLAGHAHSDQGDPVKRGRFVREQFLCEPLPPPPPTVELQPPTVTATSTTRERFEAHRKTGSTCAACHVLMDPIGVGLENFDAAGGWRTMENGRAVDTSGEIVQSKDVNGPFTGPIALTQKLATSTAAKNCIATQWFRFASGRGETPADLCTVKKVQTAFAQKGFDLKELVVALTQTDAFLYRRVP